MKQRRRRRRWKEGGREPVVALALPGVDVKRNHLCSIQLNCQQIFFHNMPIVYLLLNTIQMLLSGLWDSQTYSLVDTAQCSIRLISSDSVRLISHIIYRPFANVFFVREKLHRRWSLSSSHWLIPCRAPWPVSALPDCSPQFCGRGKSDHILGRKGEIYHISGRKGEGDHILGGKGEKFITWYYQVNWEAKIDLCVWPMLLAFKIFLCQNVPLNVLW